MISITVITVYYYVLTISIIIILKPWSSFDFADFLQSDSPELNLQKIVQNKTI